ncbi:MAG: hypothetical protein IT436_13155 [Phycisphaerales bacterium]|nr:hypothetical protein [Phycisphaerales bacterium]
MNLRARLARLEKSMVAAAAAPRACAVCGAPHRWVPCLSVKNDQGEELMPTCPACSFTVMDNGRAVTALPPGSEQKVLILDELPPV